MTSDPAPSQNKRIQLPGTSVRLQKDWAHCKLINEIYTDDLGMPFHGTVYAPGSVLEPEELGEDGLVLECVGPIGSAYNGKGRRQVGGRLASL